MPQRHRSMQAVFAYSWALLTPAEQAVFPRLAVFRGGFRREAAEAVTGATLPLLTSLVDKSLLRWQANGRYTGLDFADEAIAAAQAEVDRLGLTNLHFMVQDAPHLMNRTGTS